MKINVAFTPELAGDVSETICIVIDSLRATSVLATLFDQGCPKVIIAPSHALAEQTARKHGYLLCGETNGFKAEGFDYGNSPTEFAQMDFHGKPVVLSTTNGTKAAATVANARGVLFGAPSNRTAVANAAYALAQETHSDLLIVCSGTNGHFTLEDATTAGLYVEAIVAQGTAWDFPEQTDSAIAARRLWEADSNLLRSWMEGNHAQHLAQNGFGNDVATCSAMDTSQAIPTLVTEDKIESVAAPVLLAQK